MKTKNKIFFIIGISIMAFLFLKSRFIINKEFNNEYKVAVIKIDTSMNGVLTINDTFFSPTFCFSKGDDIRIKDSLIKEFKSETLLIKRKINNEYIIVDSLTKR